VSYSILLFLSPECLAGPVVKFHAEKLTMSRDSLIGRLEGDDLQFRIALIYMNIKQIEQQTNEGYTGLNNEWQ
jgi:hypothetical protein